FSLLVLAACAPSNVAPMTVPLDYKAIASPVEYPAPQSCASLSRVETADKRDASTIGVRHLQENPSQKADVTSTGDPSAWLREGVDSALKAGGLPMGNGPVLRVSLNSMRTDENVYRRAMYNGRVT